RIECKPEHWLRARDTGSTLGDRGVNLIDAIADPVAIRVQPIALPRHRRSAREVEHRGAEARRDSSSEGRLAAEIPLRICERDRQAAFAFEGFQISLLRRVRLRAA